MPTLSYIASFTPWGAGLAALTSNWISFTGFGFMVPVGATINAIEAKIRRGFQNPNGSITVTCKESLTSLWLGGAAVGTSKTSADNWTRTDTPSIYTGDQTYWGTALTIANLNDTGFGFAVKVMGTGAASAAQLDSVAYILSAEMTITYTTASGATVTITREAFPQSGIRISSPAQANRSNSARYAENGVPFRQFVAPTDDRTLGMSIKIRPNRSQAFGFIGLGSGSGDFFTTGKAVNDANCVGILFDGGTAYGLIRTAGTEVRVNLGAISSTNWNNYGWRIVQGPATVEFWSPLGRVASGTNYTPQPSAPMGLVIAIGSNDATSSLVDIVRLFAAQNTFQPNEW